MGCRLAFHAACTANTEQHRSLWAMVRTPVNAGHLNDTVSRSKSSAWFMTYSAQVASATIKGYTFKGIELNWGGGFQSPVITGVGDMDLVAGAAVLVGYIGSVA
jgi:hypothetical protein